MKASEQRVEPGVASPCADSVFHSGGGGGKGCAVKRARGHCLLRVHFPRFPRRLPARFGSCGYPSFRGAVEFAASRHECFATSRLRWTIWTLGDKVIGGSVRQAFRHVC